MPLKNEFECISSKLVALVKLDENVITDETQHVLFDDLRKSVTICVREIHIVAARAPRHSA